MSLGATRLESEPGPPLGPRLLRLYTGVLFERRTYLTLLYLALAFPIGLGGFIALAVALPTGAALSFTLAGIPILIASMYGWCFLAGLHVGLSNVLLGTRVGPLFAASPGKKPWHLSAIKLRLRSFMTWRALAFVLFRFPAGIASMALLGALFAHVVLLLLAPLFAELPSATVFFISQGTVVEPDESTAAGLHTFGLHITTWYGALPVMLLGLLLLPAAGHAIRLGGFLSAKSTIFILGGERGDDGSPGGAPDILGRRQVENALAWEGVLYRSSLEKHAPRTIGLHAAALGIHAMTSLAVLFVLLIINTLATPGNWWVIWVAWAAAIPLFAHAGFFARGLLGVHVGLFFIINFGLFVADAAYRPESRWFYWPLLGSSMLLAIHLAATFVYQRRRKDRPEHGVASWRRTLALALVPEERGAIVARAGASAPTRDTTNTATVQAAHPQTDSASDASGAEATIEATSAVDGPQALFTAAAVAESQIPARTGVDIDDELRRVTVDGEEVDLTPKEYELLSMLLGSPGRPFSRDHLLDRIWSNEYEVTDRTIDTHVLRLRKKLGPHGASIQTVWGIGYKWAPENGAAKAAEPRADVKSGW